MGPGLIVCQTRGDLSAQEGTWDRTSRRDTRGWSVVLFVSDTVSMVEGSKGACEGRGRIWEVLGGLGWFGGLWAVVVERGASWEGRGGSEGAVDGEDGDVISRVRDTKVIGCRLVSSVVEIYGSHHMVGMLAVEDVLFALRDREGIGESDGRRTPRVQSISQETGEWYLEKTAASRRRQPTGSTVGESAWTSGCRATLAAMK